VREVMRCPVYCVDAGASLNDCAQMLQARGITWVVIHDPAAALPDAPLAAYVGLVSEAEIMQRLEMTSDDSLCSPGRGAATAAQRAFQSRREDLLALGAGARQQQPQHQHQQPHQQRLPHAVSSATAQGGLRSQAAGGGGYSFVDRFSAAAALWELDFSEVELQRRIGEGSFGEVLLGSFRGTKVGGAPAPFRPAIRIARAGTPPPLPHRRAGAGPHAALPAPSPPGRWRSSGCAALTTAPTWSRTRRCPGPPAPPPSASSSSAR
jgi:hypothetical protein